MSKYKVTVEDDNDEDGAAALIAISVVFSIIFSILFALAAIFVAFVGVGLLWGLTKSIVNYIKGMHNEGFVNLGSVIKYAWKENVEDMQLFFDKAYDYDHILPFLVKTFLITAGVGIITIGTLTLPIWILFHMIELLIVSPFILREIL